MGVIGVVGLVVLNCLLSDEGVFKIFILGRRVVELKELLIYLE